MRRPDSIETSSKGAKSAKGTERCLRRLASGVSQMVVGESQATANIAMQFEQKGTKGTKNSKGTELFCWL